MVVKPYLIINVVDGEVGQIFERVNLSDAIELGAKLAVEQCDTTFEAAKEELETDTDFLSSDGSIHIVIAQTEDD